MTQPDLFTAKLERARDAAQSFATVTTQHKNRALEAIASAIEAHTADIIAANSRDLERGRTAGIGDGLLDRLRLDEPRLYALAAAVREVIALPDPVGETVRGSTLPNGVSIVQQRVPFGVVGVIYEARPNVTVDIAALAVKSGNGVVLRGGTAAEHSNAILVQLIQQALTAVGLAGEAVQTVDEFGREGAGRLMRARGLIDVLVPRGSAELIARVVAESTVPVIETGSGMVHVYIDESADTTMALDIVLNAKTQRTSVCNALETLLIHRGAAERMLETLAAGLREAGVTMIADPESKLRIPDARDADEETWNTEHLSLTLGIRTVTDVDAAIAHIAQHSSHHTDAIITADYANAERFLAEVDSAVVMVNTSPRFTDGGEFGFGAEVGISTQKLHARGPMGVRELTSTKWLVRGNGQIR